MCLGDGFFRAMQREKEWRESAPLITESMVAAMFYFWPSGATTCEMDLKTERISPVSDPPIRRGMRWACPDGTFLECRIVDCMSMNRNWRMVATRYES